jgi:hypothetical protein
MDHWDQMPSQMPLWVQILQALLTPVVAGLAVVIAWAQWRVVRRREVMELFERRVAIYEALRKVIGQVIPTGKVTDKDLHDFVVATDRTRFLFGDDVVKYVDGLYSQLLMYAKGRGVSQNYVEAVELFRLAAEEYCKINPRSSG